LLEVHSKDRDSNPQGSGPAHVTYAEMNRSVVDYLHRTVAEPLTSDDVWGEICETTKASSGFDAALNLSSAVLSVIKTEGQHPQESLVDYVNALATLCREQCCQQSTDLIGSSISPSVSPIN